MPVAARVQDPRAIERASPQPVYVEELHGAVGDLHRQIEERLAGPNTMAVVPLSTRPADALVQAISRHAGWAVLGGCFWAAATLLH